MLEIALLALLAALPQQGDKKGETQAPSKIKVPPSPALPPAEALKTFKIAPGFRLELVASEPLVGDPVAIAFDPDGRLWAVEMRGYMPNVDGKGEDAPVGQVVVLEDADGDGRMDRSTVFLDKLVLPRAIAIVGGGVLVAEPPQLWFCRDTDGDFKCDTKTVVDPAYAGRGNPEHTANGLLPALDNWIYNAKSSLRYRRIDGEWVRGTTFGRGQWGITQDDFGRLYYNSNPELLRGDAVPAFSPETQLGRRGVVSVQIMKDQAVWPARTNTGVNRGYGRGTLREDGTLARVTASCGPSIYRGDNFPAEFRGNAFVCEPAGNLVKRLILREENGAVSAANAAKDSEFLASTDERFRPVHLATGPDGCLYVVDMYRGILQHRNFVTSYLRREILERGLEKPTGLGRIYRVVSTAKPPGPAPRLSKALPAELLKTLSHPNGWWRDTAQRLLVDRKETASAPALRELARTAPEPRTRLHALFALEGLSAADPPTLEAAAKDTHPLLRLAAAVLKESGGPLGPLEVLFRAATADAGVADEQIAGKEIDLLDKIMGSEEWEKPNPGREKLIARIGARVTAGKRMEPVAELLELAAVQTEAARWRQRALLDGIASSKKGALKLPSRSAALVKLTHAEDDAVRARAREVWEWITWPGKAGLEPAPPRAAPLTTDERARFDRGKRQYAVTCAVCHDLSGRGEEGKGPPLVDSPWVTGSEERLIRIVLHGLTGPITVRGQIYKEAEMPAIATITSDEASEILTYIRREWGHQAAPVTAENVLRIRRTHEEREEPWTEAELKKLP